MTTPNQKEEDSREYKLVKDIITTPYEKVLLILNEIKRYISFTSKTQMKLIRDLDWIIKVITSHSLYTYDISNNEKIEKITKGNPELQQFIQFVNDYNEEVIEVNKKSNLLLTKSAQMSIDEFGLHTPSMQLKKRSVNEGGIGIGSVSSFKRRKMNSNNIVLYSSAVSSSNNNKYDYNTNTNITLKPSFTIENPNTKITIRSLNKIIQKGMQNDSKGEEKYPYATHSNHSNNNSNDMTSSIISRNPFSIDKPNLSRFHSPAQPESSKLLGGKFNWVQIESQLNKANFDLKNILSKDFDLFELRDIVGHINVLPIIGKTIFEGFGINEKMININKLDSFLVGIANGYFTTVPYHNSLHGADVTQTVAVYIINSNAEEIAETTVVDILSLFIACLGHDIGHPGLTNNYQINAYTEMALTYNDISCLENFHTAKLFRISRMIENNIFEKMPSVDYKTLRKRIISMILATDMSNHGKVISVIKAKICSGLNEPNGNGNSGVNGTFELIPKGTQNRFEIQQSLLDFLVHASDLAHNTKPFSISLQWVELLSIEFWNQGDKEKTMSLPVSFLCERIDHDIPKSQVGFIKGFIFPTFEIIVSLFPTLNYLMEYSRDNLQQWEKLVEQNRKKGWSPKERESNHILRFSNQNIVNSNSNNNNNNKPLSTNWGKPKLLIVNKGKKASSFI